jgi:major membrane immunogen (membrane-anchored lipoprotein)
MKKNLTFIAIAAAMLVSCGSSDKSAEQAATVQATKPNVRLQQLPQRL